MAKRVTIGLVAALCWLGTFAAPALAAGRICAWMAIPSPNIGAGSNELRAISHVVGTARQVWAVGSYYHAGDQHQRNLAMRWDGRRWVLVKTPSFGFGDDVLTGVLALSPSNLWVVGYFDSIDGGRKTVAMRWNGRRWKRYPTPNPAPWSELRGIAAVSRDDIWAVGRSLSNDGNWSAVALHWNGERWMRVRTPRPVPETSLRDVTRIPGTRQMWAVGFVADPAIDDAGASPLALRWDGRRWRSYYDPPVAYEDGGYTAASAISRRYAWAVGLANAGDDPHYDAFVARWNGGAWRYVGGLFSDEQEDAFNDVVAISRAHAWAVGSADDPRGPFDETLIVRWNGGDWSRVSSPNPGMDNELAAVAYSPQGGHVWAAGSFRNAGRSRTLVLRYC
jgi:hypothetical protein